MAMHKIIRSRFAAIALLAAGILGSPAGALQTVGSGQTHSTIRDAIIAADANGDTVRIFSGTYSEDFRVGGVNGTTVIDGKSNLIIEVAAGQTVTIRNPGAATGDTVMRVNNCPNFTLRGESPTSRLSIRAFGDPSLLDLDGQANHTSTIQNVLFLGALSTTGFAVALVANGDVTVEGCRWQNSGNGVVCNGTVSQEFNNCEFRILNPAFFIPMQSPGVLTVNDSFFDGRLSVTGFPAAFNWTGDNVGTSTVITNRCTFNDFAWLISDQGQTGAGKTITFNDPIIATDNLATWGFASIKTGMTVNLIGTDPDNPLDLSGKPFVFGVCRMEGGTLNVSNVVIPRGPADVGIAIEPDKPVDSPVVINVDRCVFPAETRIGNGGNEGGTGSVTIGAVNSIFLGSVVGSIATPDSLAETINTTHCTFLAATDPQGMNSLLEVSSTDVLNSAFTIFDASAVADVTPNIALNGVQNLVANGSSGGFGGGTPGDTVFGDPNLDATGHLAGPSPAVDAATASLVTVDIDNQVRPLLVAPDIGADEIPSITVINQARSLWTTY